MQIQFQPYSGSSVADILILFFNGWAMTPETVAHLTLPAGCDLLIVWDYRSDDIPAFDFTPYRQIRTVAWSMGVWAAERFYAAHPEWLTRATRLGVAVCGTGYPMDNRYGIPEPVFMGTLNGLTDTNRAKFNRRMCGGKSLKTLFDALAQRSTEEIKTELATVLAKQGGAEHTEIPPVAASLWQSAWIGAQDRIIPPANQTAYWQAVGTDIHLLNDATHYPFLTLQSWDQLWE